jgi:RNA polymerase sigma-70 factor (ECF subfamily)
MNEPSTYHDPPTPEADRLVRQVLDGDTQAFAELIRIYESDLWRIAVTLVRDWSGTENVVQQAFIDAYGHLHQYQIGTDFGAWIRTLARNRIRKEHRSLSRAQRHLAEYRQELVERLQSEEPSRDDSDIYRAALESCREALPDNEAVLLRLRYEQGKSFEAIARRQETTPAAVQRAISRIRLRLRACIEGKLT